MTLDRAYLLRQFDILGYGGDIEVMRAERAINRVLNDAGMSWQELLPLGPVKPSRPVSDTEYRTGRTEHHVDVLGRLLSRGDTDQAEKYILAFKTLLEIERDVDAAAKGR